MGTARCGTTTETVCRKQIRAVIVHGADVMDRILPSGTDFHETGEGRSASLVSAFKVMLSRSS
jgi:hypothetical protein